MPLLAPVTIATLPCCGGMSAAVHGGIGEILRVVGVRVSKGKATFCEQKVAKKLCYSGPVSAPAPRAQIRRSFCAAFLGQAFRRFYGKIGQDARTAGALEAEQA